MSLIILDICLSDIPKEAMKQSSKNGKWYAKVCCADRREKDQFDNTHTLYMSQTEEERRASTAKTYVGSGKLVATGGQATAPQQPQGYPAAPPAGYPPAPQGYPAAPQQGGTAASHGYSYPPAGYPAGAPAVYPPQQTQGAAPAAPAAPSGLPF